MQGQPAVPGCAHAKRPRLTLSHAGQRWVVGEPLLRPQLVAKVVAVALLDDFEPLWTSGWDRAFTRHLPAGPKVHPTTPPHPVLP